MTRYTVVWLGVCPRIQKLHHMWDTKEVATPTYSRKPEFSDRLLEDAQAELAQIWLDAEDRQAVTQASAGIDTALAVDPASNAAHLSEGLWRKRMTPLEVAFAIRDQDRIVEISSVKTVRVRRA